MKRFFLFCFVALLTLPAVAIDANQVKYAGGTLPGVKVGVVGKLDTTSETSLVLEYAGNKISIPYSSIESFQYTQEVARHLGVLPTIVVGLLKVRQHRHFFRISYRDQNGDQRGDQNHVAQVVILEVPKHMPRTLEAILEARGAQQTCPSCNSCGCEH
jgi:hypothetical protein